VDVAESKIDDPVTFERMIVWSEDPGRWSFVRVKVVDQATSRRGPLHIEGVARVVGYSKLTADAPAIDGRYVRRVFYFKEGDQPEDRSPQLKLPRNAVDPRQVLPGIASTRLRTS